MTLRRLLRVALVVLGGVSILLAGIAGVLLSPRPAPDGPTLAGFVVALLAIAVALGKTLRAAIGSSPSQRPWTEAGALVETPPERTPGDERVSGTSLLPVVDSAGKRARSARSVEEGLTVVRPPLRETLETALVQAGRAPEDVEAALADGSWTDDQVAAAVLDERVPPPRRSFRRRLWAWLFPERAVREWTARAVGAVAGVADETLPPVVGQNAPRPVPVVAPTLDDLQRTADGRLQRAEAVGDGSAHGLDTDDAADREGAESL